MHTILSNLFDTKVEPTEKVKTEETWGVYLE